MKRLILTVLCALFLVPGLVLGKGPNEKKMREDANELSVLGQLDKANEMMGKSTELSKKGGDGGWDGTSLFLSMIWGAFGTGYFIYGKKVSNAVFLVCGIGLCVFPMFVSDNTVSVVLGLVMTLLPFKLEI